ncbi:MAG: hypothetical protein ACOX88_00015 [Christensenellales bacterium]|jgi:hypothetical protein
MKPRKCPRCELNYIIKEDETLCDVCRNAVGEGGSEEFDNLCMECGENPVMPGQNYCIICFRNHRQAEAERLDTAQDDDEEDADIMDIRPVSQIDEIDIEALDDIPEEIRDELSSDTVEELDALDELDDELEEDESDELEDDDFLSDDDKD